MLEGQRYYSNLFQPLPFKEECVPKKYWASLGALVAKKLLANAGDTRDAGAIPRLGGGHGNPPQYSRLRNPRGQGRLAGYSPWGDKESDMTERLSTHAQMKY